MEKALKNLELRLPKTSLGGWNYGNEISAWRRCFEIIQSMPGAGRKFNAIANERDVEQLKDTLTEVKYAVIFAQFGFHIEIEPLSNKQEASSNPDLRITRDGYNSIVEIKRFRAPGPFSPGQRLQQLPDEIPERYEFPSFGDPIKDIQKILPFSYLLPPLPKSPFSPCFLVKKPGKIIKVYKHYLEDEFLDYVDRIRSGFNARTKYQSAIGCLTPSRL